MRFTSSAVAVLVATFVASLSQAEIYTGNGNTGFGGPVGNSTLTLTHDGTTVNGSLVEGGAFTETLVLYIDSVALGFADTNSFSDQGDDLRSGISGLDGSNRASLTFASGFDADYAIALSPNATSFGGLWSLAAGGDNSLIFIKSVNLSPVGTSAGPFTFSFDFADLGITSANSFDFVGSYLNAGNAFRSDEAIGDGVPATGNPGNPSSVTFTNFRTFNAVPEPTSAGLVLGCCLVGLARRRR